MQGNSPKLLLGLIPFTVYYMNAQYTIVHYDIQERCSNSALFWLTTCDYTLTLCCEQFWSTMETDI